jgi:hypothetical protein
MPKPLVYLAHRLLPLLLFSFLFLPACSRPEPPTINLYRAIHAGDLDQIKRHLYYGTDLDQVDREGQMPLHVAADQGNQVICRLLIDHGAKLSAPNRDGHTPLELAVLGGKIPVALLLLRKGAPMDPQQLLRKAILKGTDFRDVYDFLVKHGADVNAPDAVGDTSLAIAIRTGNRVTVKRLIEEGAEVNRPTASGVTPLTLARQAGHQVIIRMLQQFGAVDAPVDPE